MLAGCHSHTGKMDKVDRVINQVKPGKHCHVVFKSFYSIYRLDDQFKVGSCLCVDGSFGHCGK